ncbi:MAG: LamG-like jellyroll fold domain-containing protein [Ignavibacteria bacterium]
MKKFFYLIFLFLLFFKISYAQYTENYAASFNGSSSYISVPSSAGFSPSTAISLESWVYPTQLLLSTMGVIGKNYQTSYFLGIQTSGRVVFYPKGGSSFRSKVTSVIPVNKWSHIAATYDGTNTRIYINGILDTSSTAFTGAIGVNTDSLFFGADRVGTPSLFFKGMLDNVRIWGISRTAAQISQNKSSPLEILNPTGEYAGLKGSFQLDNNALNYGGSELNIGTARNVTFVNYTTDPVNYLDYNNSLVLNGTTDDFSVNNNSTFNVTNAITLEAWIRRDTTGTQPAVQNIVNKSGGASRYDYALFMQSTGQLIFEISSGSYTVSTFPVITNSRWTHVAATYNTTDGYAIIYINGVYQTSSLFTGHPAVPNNPDKLFIGGIGATSYAANKFKGQIDGARVWKVLRTPDQIRLNMFSNIRDINLANFDFDKFANSTRNGSTTILGGGTFGGSAHISSSHAGLNNELSSPSLGNSLLSYEQSYRGFFVPDNFSNGIKDSIFISDPGNITRLRAYVLMTHTYTADVTITLISPLGTSRILMGLQGSSGNDVMTIFTDDADSLASSGLDVNGPGITAAFSPVIKPLQSLSVFNGQNKQGWWKIKFSDNVPSDRGYVNSWGIETTSGLYVRTLKLTALIQGFYNSLSNKLKGDTLRVYLKNASAPYNNLDSSKSVLDSSGKGNFPFVNISNGVPFFIVTSHRNSIETWSSAGYVFSSDTLYYDFTLAASQAYGANQIQIDASPLEFAIYNGDADRNDQVNLNDILLVSNDVVNFVSGYVKTDMTGDNSTNLTDLILTSNNSSNFVVKIRP